MIAAGTIPYYLLVKARVGERQLFSAIGGGNPTCARAFQAGHAVVKIPSGFADGWKDGRRVHDHFRCQCTMDTFHWHNRHTDTYQTCSSCQLVSCAGRTYPLFSLQLGQVDCTCHGAVTNIVRMQVVTAVINRIHGRRIKRVLHHPVEIYNTIDILVIPDPGVKHLPL